MSFSFNIHNRASKTFLITFAFFILFIIVNIFYNRFSDNNNFRFRKFVKVLHEKEHLTLQNLQILSVLTPPENFNDYYKLNLHNLENKGLFFFSLLEDSLEYWSSSKVPVTSSYLLPACNNQLLFIENGWYLSKVLEHGSYKYIGLIGLYHDYSFQNEYLQDSFFEGFYSDKSILFSPEDSGKSVYSTDGDFIGSIKFFPSASSNGIFFYAVFIIFLTLLVLIVRSIYFLYTLIPVFRNRWHLLFLMFFLDVAILRFLIYYFHFPGSIHSSSFFDPYGFSTSVINSTLGDTIINLFLILIIAFIYYSYSPRVPFLKNKRIFRFYSAFSILIITFFFDILINFIHSLILDSSFSINLQSIYSLDYLSIIGILLITVSLFSFILFSYRTFTAISSAHKNRLELMAFSAVIVLLYSIIVTLNSGEFPYTFIFLLIYLVSLTWSTFSSNRSPEFSYIIFNLVLFAGLSNLILNQDNTLKERKYRQLLLTELSGERDPSLEFDFLSKEKQIISDTTILRLANNPILPDSTIYFLEDYIQEKYFSEFEKDYRIQATICREYQLLEIQPERYLIPCFEYFDTIIQSSGSNTLSPNLFYLEDNTENMNYLASVRITSPDSIITNVFVDFYSELIPEEGLGYPDLLLDKDNNFISNLAEYSFARYKNGSLTYKFGTFPYNIYLSSYLPDQIMNNQFDLLGYNHLLQDSENGNLLVISINRPDLLEQIAPFSYLFIFFGLFLILFFLIAYFPQKLRDIKFHFRDRLQFSIISIILIAFIIIGIISRIYIIRLNEDKNRDILREKTLSVLVELEHKVTDRQDLSYENLPYLTNILNKFSLVFFSDINLYDTTGSIIVSSRPEIFNSGLLSEKMNPTSYKNLKYDYLLEFIHKETIGKQIYLSSYIPFRNNKDEIIAFLNLPYFAKQRDLQSEISSFLIAYINIYILTIIFTILITIFVSKYITRPLEIISLRLRNLKIGNVNDKIEWRHDDEIGGLVNEYNRMLDELARSAETIVRSEREGAWREMAQQVAHEIKNPLTPMRLNVQHLKKSWEDHVPDWEKRLSDFSSNMLEQIDSLSQIASAFSDFAKMPKASIEKIDLYEIALQSLELFKDHPKIDFSIIPTTKDSYFVNADKKQFSRVFNNLLRNSVQAIGNQADGKIDIAFINNPPYITIRITDDGSGIPKEQEDKIFQPSFTTKSGGMGLGLAIADSIIRNASGTIDFESEPGEFTTFTINIPAAD